MELDNIAVHLLVYLAHVGWNVACLNLPTFVTNVTRSLILDLNGVFIDLYIVPMP